MRPHLAPLVALALMGSPACSSSDSAAAPAAGDPDGSTTPSWLSDAKILVPGQDVANQDCRTGICRHNENTDMITWKGAIWLVHRTAMSQRLGPNSSLVVYRSTDGGATFDTQAVLPAVQDRDLRDPSFYVVGDQLYMKALARLAVDSTRDSNVDTATLVTHSADGKTWTDLADVAPHTWSLWRVKEHGGSYYGAAYEDGDKSVSLFTSQDGSTWTKGAQVYGVAADTPLETELTFMPSGRMLALVRMDGTDDELIGDAGRLRTKVCWATAPYTSFDCPAELSGQRLDGPLSFFWKDRLFVVARKHLQGTGKKRTALFELTGDLEGGALSIREWGELPSGGDTSYAGVAAKDDTHVLLTWYSGDVASDSNWTLGMFLPTDIWQGTVDLSLLQ